MLILTRRVGERIFIGENITVEVLGVRGNQVRIGVSAPAATPIHREEVAKRIKAENGAGVTPQLPLGGVQ